MIFRNRHKKVNIKAFDCYVQLILTEDVYKTEISVYKKHGINENPIEEGTAEGLTVAVNFNLYVIVLDINRISYNLVGHEVFHAVHVITKDRDIEDEETKAWLTGYLCEEVHTFINKIKYEQPRKKTIIKDLSGCNNRPDSQGSVGN